MCACEISKYLNEYLNKYKYSLMKKNVCTSLNFKLKKQLIARIEN